MGIKKIAVLGAGVMGAGIAQVAAQGGYEVMIRDLRHTLVQRGLHGIEKSLDNSINNGAITTEARDQIMSRITGVTDLSEIHEADMVIESIVENMSVKKQVFAELDGIFAEDVVLATNTSSLSIAEIASGTKHKNRIIGMHFFYPVPFMSLIEVVKGIETSDQTVKRTIDVTRNMGKECILVERESPAFIVNRIIAPMINEAVGIYAEGLASREDIDQAMKLGAGMPVGPLEMADRLGVDTIYSVILNMYEEFRDSKYRPHPLLSTMMRAGHFGRKTGRGFYEYNCDKKDSRN